MRTNSQVKIVPHYSVLLEFCLAPCAYGFQERKKTYETAYLSRIHFHFLNLYSKVYFSILNLFVPARMESTSVSHVIHHVKCGLKSFLLTQSYSKYYFCCFLLQYAPNHIIYYV